MKEFTNKIEMVIDVPTMEEYSKYYFKKYPKRRKFPFQTKSGKINPIPPSLNKWMVMLRPEMNNTKQQWKEFSIWLVSQYNLTGMQIDDCYITYIVYKPTKIRFDLDNIVMSPKVLNDGFVEAGMLVDDSVYQVKKLSFEGGYDKNNPRVEIIIKY